MTVVIDGSTSVHVSQREVDKHEDTDGKRCNDLSDMSTMETMPTLADLHDKNTLDDDDDWEKDSPLDDMDNLDLYDHLSPFECRPRTDFSADEGRQCDINYSDFEDDLLSEPSCSAVNDLLLGEMPAEPLATKECIFTFPVSLKQNDIFGKVRKPSWRIKTCSYEDEDEEEEEPLEDQFLAKFKILTQITQRAEETQDRFPSEQQGFSWKVSAASRFSRQFSVPVDDLNARHRAFGRRFRVPTDLEALPSQNVYPPPQKQQNVYPPPQKQMMALDSRSVTLHRVPTDASNRDEAVNMETFAGAPGRALRKMRVSNFKC